MKISLRRIVFKMYPLKVHYENGSEEGYLPEGEFRFGEGYRSDHRNIAMSRQGNVVEIKRARL
jgi:hypothetical protein